MQAFVITEEENKKTRLKALGLTLATMAVLAFLFLFVSWTHIIAPPQATQESGGIEVNLGNADQGWGNEPPMVPGDPAKEDNTPAEEPASQHNPAPAATEEASTSKEVADNNDADAPEIKTAPKPKTIPQRNITPAEKPKVSVKNNTPASQPAQQTAKAELPKAPEPKAKALYKGGNGNGGNGADSYNGVKNQGIAGGRGDQGKPNGNPNSDSYTGNGGSGGGNGNGNGSGGVSITDGLNGRKLFSAAFNDKFNQNARVSVNITVNASGHVTSASISPRGTTTTDANIRGIARRRAMELKFSPGSADNQTGTIQFNFKVRE